MKFFKVNKIAPYTEKFPGLPGGDVLTVLRNQGASLAIHNSEGAHVEKNIPVLSTSYRMPRGTNTVIVEAPWDGSAEETVFMFAVGGFPVIMGTPGRDMRHGNAAAIPTPPGVTHTFQAQLYTRYSSIDIIDAAGLAIATKVVNSTGVIVIDSPPRPTPRQLPWDLPAGRYNIELTNADTTSNARLSYCLRGGI